MTAKGHLMGAAVCVQAKETEELRCLATRMGGEKAAPALPVANRTASVALARYQRHAHANKGGATQPCKRSC